MAETESFERVLDARLICSIVATGAMTFSGILVETAMNVTFPTLMNEFGVSTSSVQWVTTGYLLVLAIVIPASSYLNRRFTKRALFIAAVALFLAGTILGAVAPSFAVLVIARLVQGTGTGIAWPLMNNIIVEQAPVEKRGMLMGLAVLISVLPPALGPAYGGFLSTHLTWRYIFIILLPLLVVSLVLGIRSIRSGRPHAQGSFQFGQFLLLASMLTCLIVCTSYGADLGWASLTTLALLAAAAVLGVVFCMVSLRSGRPLIDVRIFKLPTFAFSILGLICIQAIILGYGFLIPNFAQIVDGQTAFVAGCILVPDCFLGAILSPLSGHLLDRVGPRIPIMTGSAFVVASAILFTVFYRNAGVVALALIYIEFIVGQTLSLSNIQTNGLSCLPPDKTSDGTATTTASAQLGSALGTSIAAGIVEGAQQTGPALSVATSQGTGLGFIACIVVSVLVVVFYACATARHKKRTHEG